MPKNPENSNFLADVKIKSYVGHKDDVTCCAFSTDWSLLATGADDTTLKLWNMKNNKLLFTMTGHTKSLKCICFSEDNLQVASGGHDTMTMVWCVSDGKQTNKLTGHLLAVESVSFSRSGFLLCSCSWDNTAILWDLPSSSPVRILDDHCSVVQCCAFSLKGDMLATAAWDYMIYVYNITENIKEDMRRTVLEFKEKLSSNSEDIPDFNMNSTKPVNGNKRPSTAGIPVNSIQSSQRNKNKRPSTSHPGRLKKPNSNLDMAVLKGHKSNIKDLAFSSTDLLVSASWDCTLILWNPKTGIKIHHLMGHDGFVQACAFSYDSLYLASAADDNTVKIWHVKDGSLIKTLDSFTEEIHQLSFTNSGTLLASGPEQLSLQLY